MKKFKLKTAQGRKLPRLTPEMLGIVIEVKSDVENHEEAERDAAAMREGARAYLENFAEPDACPGCLRTLGGIVGTFVWGMTHGEGHCSNCGYPCRARHTMPGGLILNNAVLPFHPDVLIPKQKQVTKLHEGTLTYGGKTVEVADITITTPSESGEAPTV